MKEVFPKRLKQARKLRDWSQTELAKHTGLLPSAISHFENGRRTPHIRNLRKLAIALKVTSDYLLGIKI